MNTYLNVNCSEGVISLAIKRDDTVVWRDRFTYSSSTEDIPTEEIIKRIRAKIALSKNTEDEIVEAINDDYDMDHVFVLDRFNRLVT